MAGDPHAPFRDHKRLKRLLNPVRGFKAALALGLVVLLFRRRATLSAEAWSELGEA